MQTIPQKPYDWIDIYQKQLGCLFLLFFLKKNNFIWLQAKREIYKQKKNIYNFRKNTKYQIKYRLKAVIIKMRHTKLLEIINII